MNAQKNKELIQKLKEEIKKSHVKSSQRYYLEKLLKKFQKTTKTRMKKELKTANTIINKDTLINQEFIDNNPGPYQVEGGNEIKKVKIKFDNIIINNLEQYFIINSDHILFYGERIGIINIINIENYIGLIHNTGNYSNITIRNLGLGNENSTLIKYGGWLVGENFGYEATNNYIFSCINYGDLINEGCGGFVGANCNIYIKNCENYGSFGNNRDIGGICGERTKGIIENCTNYSDVTEYNSGIISDVNNNIIIKNCINGGKLIGGDGIVGFINSEPQVLIQNCSNRGEFKSIYSSGIIGAISGGYVRILNCINNGNINDYNSGILGFALGFFEIPQVIIRNCVNDGNIGNKSSGICGGFSYVSDSEIVNCTNNGKITGELSSGIISDIEGYFIINKCINNGTLLNNNTSGIVLSIVDYGKITNCKNTSSLTYKNSSGIVNEILEPFLWNSDDSDGNIINNCINEGDLISNNNGGILGINSVAKVINCKNKASIVGVNSGGIFPANSEEGCIAENCINYGSIIGLNAGGIFGDYSKGTAINCKNQGKIIGLNAQPIFGPNSTGKIE